MEWKFKKYEDDDVQRDSSSDKFFKESAESESLIREFIQNSLDAASDNSQPVKVVIKKKTVQKSQCSQFLKTLQPHLKACNIEVNEPYVNFIVMEDFKTKGLEGDNLKDFFQKDNITHKTKGGGSHGIGKAVFHALSQIKTFFGYSIFNDQNNSKKSVFCGRAVLNTHKIKSDEYGPDGVLKITPEEHKDFIALLFTRKATERGLSVAIPHCNIEISDIQENCLNQFYMPIINKKLEITIEDSNINDETLLKLNKPQVNLAMDYKTIDKITREYTIKEKDWKNQQFPQLKEQGFTENDKPLVISFKIDIMFSDKSTKRGEAILLIKKLDDTQELSIDCWRDNLLISSALGHRRKERGYTIIFLIDNNPLSKLLRELEDPGHTKWQTGTLTDKIKNQYKNVRDLVKFVKKLPTKIIRQIKNQPITKDSKFFADYFPEVSYTEKQESKEKGQSNTSGGTEMTDKIQDLDFQDFKYREHRNGDGFKLTLKDSQKIPASIEVKAAYGTNKGDAFANYDKRDFQFENDIQITINSGKKIYCEENSVKYSIIDEKFSIAFSGFDPNRELRIEVK